MLPLGLTAHNVIVGLFLPKGPLSSKKSVDLECAAAFPALHHFSQCSLSRRDKCMKVIRHQNPGIQRWFRAEPSNKNLSHIHSPKVTLPMARVEPCVPLFREGSVKLILLFLR